VAVAAAAAGVKIWPHAWPWLITAVVIIAAGTPVGISALTAAVQRRTDAARAVRQGLQGTAGRTLLRVQDMANLDARVHRAVLPIPYIHRDIEDQARRYLASGRPVLLVGSSMVGKTQMAATLISDMFAGRGIAIPDSMGALAALEAADVAIRGSVIFLDDIGRLIGSGGITDGSLRRLAAAGNAIVGTIRAAEYDRYQPTDQLRPPEWDVLCVFERVFVSRVLSAAETDRLTAAVSDRDVRDRIIGTGLGEYVGAAEHIEEALRLGPSVNPAGYALVQGAADWQRAGMSAPVPVSALPALAAPHLPARDHAALADKQLLETALQWATRDINPTAALIQREEQGCFTIYDYALDILSSEGAPIPLTTWPILIQHAAPADLLSVGYTAEVSYHKPEVALQAWRKAASSGNPDAAPQAALNLGILLQRLGDAEGARAAYQLAIDSGHADTAPMAAVNLGFVLQEQGSLDGARAAYQLAIDSGHADTAPMAAFNLGALLTELGDTEAARTAYQLAIDSGHVEHAPSAAVNLGLLLQEQGDLDGARAAYQLAIGYGHADTSPMALVNLGSVLKELGDAQGARAAYQRAIDSDDVDAATSAAFNLGVLLDDLRDAEGARAAYQLVIDSGQAERVPGAAVNLGSVLQRQGDAEGARAAYQLAIDSDDADSAPMAAFDLGLLLDNLGDAEGARAAFQLAIDSGHPDAVPMAAINLGIPLKERGDAEGARAAFQLAIDSGHADAAPRAEFNLGLLLQEQGDSDGAQAAYQRAIDSRHPGVSPRAELILGLLLNELAEVARAANQHGISSGDSDATPRATPAAENI
jgi:tetratricopeptide (TPR) repeat protein